MDFVDYPDAGWRTGSPSSWFWQNKQLNIRLRHTAEKQLPDRYINSASAKRIPVHGLILPGWQFINSANTSRAEKFFPFSVTLENC